MPIINSTRRNLWLAGVALLGLTLPMFSFAQCPPGGIVDITTGLCSMGPGGPAPPAVNQMWNVIAFARSINLAVWTGSFTGAEYAEQVALKACRARAPDCKIIAAVHDTCLAVAYERKPGGAYRWATGTTREAAQGAALVVCKDEGPKRCAVLSECTGTPPIVRVAVP